MAAPNQVAAAQAQPTSDGREWLSLPEVPTSHELTQWARDGQGHLLQPNQLDGAWPSTEEYLRTQYAVAREEGVFALRGALRVLNDSSDHDEATLRQDSPGICIYEKVRVKGLVFASRAVAVRLAFSTERSGVQIVWKSSKRLQSGSLIALITSNNITPQTIIPAIVAARPLANLEKQRPEIDVFIPSHQLLDPAVDYTMVEEGSSYFEAQRYSLLALQQMAKEAESTFKFPMSNYIVDVQTQVSCTPQVQKWPCMDLTPAGFHSSSGLRNVIDLDWSTLGHPTMDDSQQNALGHMMTKDLAIVQGPPGTGKTHVSVLAVRLLLLGTQQTYGSPIVVACQTNHALDALLERLDDEFHDSYVRLGGRSTNERIKERTLHEVREVSRRAGRGTAQPSSTLPRLEKDIRRTLNGLYPKDSLLVADDFFFDRGLLTRKQQESLKSSGGNWQSEDDVGDSDKPCLLQKWLGKVPPPPQAPTNDFGYGTYEGDPNDEDLLDGATAEQLAHYESLETLKGSYYALSEGTSYPKSAVTESYLEALLKKNDNLNKIQHSLRGAVYTMLFAKAKAELLVTCQQLMERYQRESLSRYDALSKENAVVCRRQKIIGVTITGFAKYRDLLARVRPRTVLIEEAGESVEYNQVTACVPSVEQLILVGDHQQLRPRVQKGEHEKLKYEFSLMERLVRNNVDYKQLNVQRRMAPEISRLLQPIYGDNYKDHYSLNDRTRPDIPGMGGFNSAFVDHRFPEAPDQNKSTVNEAEADLIVGFAKYLVQNGMLPEQIVILTFYNGQRKALLRRIRANTYLDDKPGIQVKNVDSFQGEEAEVILLSLVRNNNEDKTGFVKIENRICVALSRARRGSYIFGNEYLLSNHGGSVWKEVFKILRDQGPVRTRLQGSKDSRPECRIHNALLLRCKKHDTPSSVDRPSYWNEHPHGGCTEKCKDLLDCEHACPLPCHPYSHDEVECIVSCDRILPCDHQCSSTCGARCFCYECAKGQQARLAADTEFQTEPYIHASKVAAQKSKAVHRLAPGYTSIGSVKADEGPYTAGVAEDAEGSWANLPDLPPFKGVPPTRKKHDSSGSENSVFKMVTHRASSSSQKQHASSSEANYTTSSTPQRLDMGRDVGRHQQPQAGQFWPTQLLSPESSAQQNSILRPGWLHNPGAVADRQSSNQTQKSGKGTKQQRSQKEQMLPLN